MLRKLAFSDFLIFHPFIFLAFFSLFFTCQPKERQTQQSFYFWKTNFLLDSVEQNYLEALEVKKLYLRYFDVAWNEAKQQAQPLGILQISDKNKPLAQLHRIIPTVFITNQTLLRLPDSLRPVLAQQIAQQLLTIQQQATFKKTFPNAIIDEVQLDCDWSVQSRAAFFDLIRLLKTQLSKQINLGVTLRLHQYKYPEKTGVPPVQVVNLMCYNTGNLQDPSTLNSILDIATVKSYLPSRKKKYPLSLRIAVPIYAWAVLLRSGKVINLIANTDTHAFETPKFKKIAAEGHYQVIESHYFKGIYLYKDDVLRFEHISPQQLHELTQLLKQHFKTEIKEWIFFHLNSVDLKKFSIESLKKVQ